MYWNYLNDRRLVIVDSSTQQTRIVKDEEFFLAPEYVNVLLDGQWQVVKKSRLKAAQFGSPFQQQLQGSGKPGKAHPRKEDDTK